MKILEIDSDELVAHITHGAVGILPTDTVYGIVASLTDNKALEKIFSIKRRDQDKRIGTILISSIDQIDEYVDSGCLHKAQQYWPGPTSVVLPIKHGCLEVAHRGHSTLAFRIPDSQQLRAIIEKTGPIASSSANLQGGNTVTTISEAIEVFGDKVDYYVDGGNMEGRRPSKIIEITHDDNVYEVRS